MNPTETLRAVLDAKNGMLLTAIVEAAPYIQGKVPPLTPSLEVRTLLDAAVVTGVGTAWTREADGTQPEASGEFFVPVYDEVSRNLPFTVSVDRYRAVIYQLYLAVPPRGVTDSGLLVRTITPAGQTILRAEVVQAKGKDGLVFQLPLPDRGQRRG